MGHGYRKQIAGKRQESPITKHRRYLHSASKGSVWRYFASCCVNLTGFSGRIGRETRPRERIVMDSGSEVCSAEFRKWAKANHCEMAVIQPGKPMQNGFVQSSHVKLRKALLQWNWFADRLKLQGKRDRYRREFYIIRPHRSLKYLKPVSTESYSKLKIR